MTLIKSSRDLSIRPLLSQVCIAMLGLLLLAFAPPAHGKMILVPLTAGAASGMAATALSSGSLLVASGPIPGSLIVVGNRAALANPMFRQGVLVLAAPPAGCGASLPSEKTGT
jgi:hypothetical protein